MRKISSSKWFLWVDFSDADLITALSFLHTVCHLVFIFFLTVSVCKFLSQPFLHWILPQRHGAPEGGTSLVFFPVCFRLSLILQSCLPALVGSFNALLYLWCCIDSCTHSCTCASVFVRFVKKMLLVLSLLRSLQRQVRDNLLPYLLVKSQMVFVSVPKFFRAFLRSKVWILWSRSRWDKQSLSGPFFY